VTSVEPAERSLAELDVLRRPEAGAKVIRGGALRGLGYAVGLVLNAAAAFLLLRHLGVVDFGRFVTVTALLGIVAGVTDAGLTAVGGREMAVRTRGSDRDVLLQNLIALRLITTVLGVGGAVVFAVVAGYGATLVYGVLLGGLGILLLNAQSMMMMPLWVGLRFVALTVSEVGRQLLTLVGIAILVAVGATLLPFFAVQVGVGAVLVAVTPLLVGTATGLVPRFDWPTCRMLVREALPLALAFAMSVIYFRLLVILISLLEPGVETGLFATSFRVFEVLLLAPTLVLSAALPVLSVAGHEDEERLRYSLQRLSEVSLTVAALLALVVAILAEPALRLVDEEYVDAAPVLRVQAIALVPLFLVQTWQLALIAVRGQRAMVIANGTALAVVLALGLLLIPRWGADGAAWAAVAAEATLACMLFVLLRRSRPGATPRLAFTWKVAAAAAAGAAALLVPGLPALATAALAVVAFAVVAFATRVVPPELLRAFVSRDGEPGE
jgi:O-antigen/teichoic acid export membrane protein